MSVENDLSLAFVGKSHVHAENSRALLKDLIAAHRRLNAAGRIQFFLPLDSWSPTFDDLADFCLSIKADLNLVGTAEQLEQSRYFEVAKRAYQVRHPTRTLLRQLLPECGNPRLILVGDTDDDFVYSAVELAIEHGVHVRDLLRGLDNVEISDTTEIEKEDEGMTKDLQVVEEDEYEEDDDLYDSEDEVEDEDVEDENVEEDEDEEDEDEVLAEDDEEIEDEDADDDDDEVLVDEDEDEDEEDEDDEDEDEEEDEEDDDVEAVSDEDEEDDVPVIRPVENRVEKKKEKNKVAKRYSEDELLEMAEENREKFLAIMAKYDILPGRGIRNPTMVRRYLEATGQAPSEGTARRMAEAKPKAKASATTVKRGPGRPPKAAQEPAGRASSASSNGVGTLDRRLLRQFVKVTQAALDVIEASLSSR